jgi:plasmid stability protein
MKNYTVRNIPEEQYTAIRIQAARLGISINALLLLIIAEQAKKEE